MSLELLECQPEWARRWFLKHPEYTPVHGDIERSIDQHGIWFDVGKTTGMVPWEMALQELNLPDGTEEL